MVQKNGFYGEFVTLFHRSRGSDTEVEAGDLNAQVGELGEPESRESNQVLHQLLFIHV